MKMERKRKNEQENLFNAIERGRKKERSCKRVRERVKKKSKVKKVRGPKRC